MVFSKVSRLVLLGGLICIESAQAQDVTPAPNPAPAPATLPYSAPPEVIAKIKDEGMNRSQIMPAIGYLTDVIGARLTGSPALYRANEWTRDQMTKWGLENSHLEAWGPFGRGWTVNGFYAQVTKPYGIPLIAYPKAWSPATKGAVTGEVIYFDAKDGDDFSKYKGQLKGKIVLVSAPRELKALVDPLAVRRTDESLAKMAAAEAPKPPTLMVPPAKPEDGVAAMKRITNTANRLNFLKKEGAAVLVENSSGGSGGTIFVLNASVPQDIPKTPEEALAPRMWGYHKGAEERMVPQMTMATEHYNRLVNMLKAGEKLTMTVNIDVQYQDKDPMAYNTIAEIPGADLKDEVVMLGGHLDSWHGATGATDNASGVAVCMEAARIIKALGLQPRRTIRVGLWTGEEHGLLGSTAYVKQHFAELSPKVPGQLRQILKKADYDKVSAYYNLDGGTGKIRGMFGQGNAGTAPIFKEWLKPFADMGAGTFTMSNTGGTDHLTFDQVGLPGFQFIQDPVEYGSRTHHSNQDNFDRIQEDDVKQSAVIMAAFVYQTAMMDEKLPRKAFAE